MYVQGPSRGRRLSNPSQKSARSLRGVLDRMDRKSAHGHSLLCGLSSLTRTSSHSHPGLNEHYWACASFASSVIRTGISSLTAGRNFVTPKSERLMTVVASKPAVCALTTPGISKRPILLTLASSVTGLVTPCTVRSPVILRPFSPVFSILVLLNVIVGYLAESKKSGLLSTSSSFATRVSRPSTGKVTTTDDLVRSALSSSTLPSILSKRALGLEKPKWFQPKTTPLCEASISYSSAAACAPAAAKTDRPADSRAIKLRRFMMEVLSKLMWKCF